MNGRTEFVIEREYPYGGSIVLNVIGVAAFVCLAVFFASPVGDETIQLILRNAAHGDQWAMVLKWALTLYCIGLCCGFLYLAWMRSSLRIVISPEGIRMPRKRWRFREEFVAYEDITDLVMVFVNGVVWSLRFQTPTGAFFIARSLLSKEHFEEIVSLLPKRVSSSRTP